MTRGSVAEVRKIRSTMSDVFESIPRQGRPASVARQLQGAILSGALRPGERLPALTELSQRLDVSVAALREALAALEAAGLIELRHGYGTFVRERPPAHPALVGWIGFGGDETEQRGMREARRVLEVELAGLAAERAGAHGHETLEAALAEMASSVGDPVAFGDADVRFHLTVAKLADSPVLHRMLSALSQVLAAQLQRNAERASRRTLTASVARHRALVDAVGARDPQAAREAMATIVEHAAQR
jgi:GntR family transcriptional repressor for pyruvate dehydrogenase complex